MDDRRGTGFVTCGARTCRAILAALLTVVTLAFVLCTASLAKADDSAGGANVTDTQNLLGANTAKIDDAIASTERDTGVSVRLLYVKSFTGSKNPDKWVSDALESTKPKADTVMLAVASDDGRLVVAVSKNSENWLKDKKNVDKLSQAAIEPLQRTDIPDWSGSALAMMDKIKAIRHTRKVVCISIIAGVVVLVLVAAGVGYWIWSGRHHKDGHGHGARHRRKH